jgi:hypothetical protein
VLLLASLAAGAQRSDPLGPFESSRHHTPRTRVDELVFGRLEKLGIRPARACSDAVFLRRAYLDVIGTLPTAKEARAFLRSKQKGKRAALVDELLEREEFADYQALRWCDLLRVKAEFPINLWPNAVQAYYRWIHTCIKDNRPYDSMARQMLTASGSSFRVPQVNFWRAVQSHEPESLAGAVALTFMGARAESFSPERLSRVAALFAYVGRKRTSEWKEEILVFDSTRMSAGDLPDAAFPDGTPVELSPDRDPREQFADWLIRADNPWFARNVVNRIWFWCLGRGVVHEPDDLRDDNPASVPGLLEYLAEELVEADYDLKHVYRLILNSRTYQLSPIPRTEHPEAAACFAHYALRRLDAEVLVDALCQITGTTEEYSSAIPEPFTYIPEEQRSIELSDGSITSPFLELFGRPPRDTGLASERDNASSPAQRLHLLNSSHVRSKIERGPGLRSVLRARGDPRRKADELYLMILSRYPTPEERERMRAHFGSSPERREAAVDLVWALLNSAEFLYRH